MGRRSAFGHRRRYQASPRGSRAPAALFLCAFVIATPLANAAAQETLAQDAIAPPTAADGNRDSTAQSGDITAALQRRGDLSLRNLPLTTALFTIGEQWNVSIVPGEVTGTANGDFKAASLSEILDAILLANGYNYRVQGSSIVIGRIQEFGATSSSMQSATIVIHSADIDEVVQGAMVFLSPQGKIQALKSVRSIVVLDFPDRVQMIRNFVATVEGVTSGRFATPGSTAGLPLQVGYYHTQYIPAKAAEQALVAVLSKDGRVGVLEKEDRLVVSDYAENLAMVEKVLERIDRPRPQVRITALIYDIGLEDIENLGFNWNKLGYRSGDNTALGLGITPLASVPLDFEQSAGVAAVEGAAITFGALSRHFDIGAVAAALAQIKDARLMGNPNVAVLENEEAIFKSIQEIPFQQLTQTGQGGQIGTTAFREAGITLVVRPKIAADGTIEMVVSPEFSRLASALVPGQQPTIDRRTATTVLRVINRQTVVIGGLRQRSDVGDFNGVPYLKDIPGAGRLFRSRNTNVRESELVVFIMPEIIDFADRPGFRDQLAADTVNCRLSHIPLAEGCPPSCQGLPCNPSIAAPAPLMEMGPPATGQRMGPHQTTALPPAVGTSASPAQLIGGPRAAQWPAAVDAEPRRLPAISPHMASAATGQYSAPPVPTNLFAAPPSTPSSRTAIRHLPPVDRR